MFEKPPRWQTIKPIYHLIKSCPSTRWAHPFSKCPCCRHCHLDQMDFPPEWRCCFRKSFVSLFAIQPSAAPSHGQQRQIVKSLPPSLCPPRSPRRYPHSPPLRSNISVVQSIALDRQLLELELGRLVTDNMACLFNFVSCNGVALKWLTINHHGCLSVSLVSVMGNDRSSVLAHASKPLCACERRARHRRKWRRERE